jgi:D-sedoheptulose 7-phosphate isomerase
MSDRIKAHFTEAAEVLNGFLSDETKMQSIADAGELMIASLNGGNKIISCGNGGSMSDAMHFAEELSGRFRDDRPAIAAVSISDPSHITCVANDMGFDKVFSRYVEAMGQEGDVLLAISTSGNSPNVLNAAKAAKERGMKVVGLTGKSGGELAALCDAAVTVAHDGYADRIQEVHIKVIHAWIDMIESSN